MKESIFLSILLYIQQLYRKIKFLYPLVAVVITGVIFTNVVSAQTDSTVFQLDFNMRGRWQTGNLQQLGLNPNAKFRILDKNIEHYIQVDYQYLSVNNFTIISDFWARNFSKYKAGQNIYPLILGHYGFAKSYKIEHSYLLSVGAGVNLISSTPDKYLHANVVGGYLNFKLEEGEAYQVPALSLLIGSQFPIASKWRLFWEFQSYHSTEDTHFWGANNALIIAYQVLPVFSISSSHHVIFNNVAASGIEKTNTLLLFGIQFQFIHKS